MDLSEFLRALRRNWILPVSTGLVGLLLAGGFTILVKPTYTSETQLFVAIQSSGSISELQQGNTFGQARVQSYVKTVQTPAVLQPVIDALGLDIRSDQLASKVEASTDLNTVLINISVEDGSPVQAAAIAQSVADSLVRVVNELESPRAGEGTSPVSLSIIRPAVAPLSPSAPNPRLNLILGLLIGVVGGVAAAAIRTTLDNSIRGATDLRKVTDAPLLGGIAFDPEAEKKPLLTQALHQSPRSEAFRQLRTNLNFANISGNAKTVLITSSLPGEGKSTVAVNLALSLAQAGQRVCLVDADLRRPMIDEYLRLERGAGLTTALVRQADIEELLQPWGEDELHVLTSGQIPPNPSEMLGSGEMQRLLGRLEELFDTVIVDAPPLLPVTDAAVLSQHVGGVVVVVGAHKIRQNELTSALSSLELIHANVLGMVLNRLPTRGPESYSYSYQSYTSEEQPRNLVEVAQSNISASEMREDPLLRERNSAPVGYKSQIARRRSVAQAHADEN